MRDCLRKMTDRSPSFPPHRPTCLVHWLSSEAMMLTVRSSSSPAALSSFFFTCGRDTQSQGSSKERENQLVSSHYALLQQRAPNPLLPVMEVTSSSWT